MREVEETTTIDLTQFLHSINCFVADVVALLRVLLFASEKKKVRW